MRPFPLGDPMRELLIERLELACDKVIHCPACRLSIEQRHAIGWPDKCPRGYTERNLPVQPPKIPKGQMAICKKCPKFKNCRCITFCKSCGGKEAPRFAGKCPKLDT